MTIQEIDPAVVRVAFATPIEPVNVVGRAETLAVLSEDEVSRMARFHFGRDRQLFVSARALVRRTLSQYLDIMPADWRFATDQHGRPEVVFPSEGRVLKFSVAHTDGLVMCAVAVDRAVGADVEHMRECPLDVVNRFFAPDRSAGHPRTHGRRAGEAILDILDTKRILHQGSWTRLIDSNG